MSQNWRIQTQEIDLSANAIGTTTYTGYMVVTSAKGRGDVPTKVSSENDVFTNFGIPSPSYPSLYEAVAYTRSADLWCIAAIGSGSLYGGMDVTALGASSFGNGRVDIASFDYTASVATTGDILVHSGLVYSGVLSNFPYVSASLVLKDGNTTITASETGGSITGSGIVGTGTLNATTGAYYFTLTGTPSSTVTASYSYNNTDVSHSLFASSQYVDDLRVDISHLSGYQFQAILSQKNTKNFYQVITTYTYSLIREKSTDGASLYIEDVFDNDPYIVPKLNANFSMTSTTFNSFVDTTNVLFAGGSRGAAPTSAEINTAWDFAKKTTKYKVGLLMDVYGTHTQYINSLITTYQPYAYGISVIPYGVCSNADEDILYRQTLAMDTDKVSLYTNWMKIKEPYQSSFVWISNVGSIGRRYIASVPSYNFEAPAGVNTNGYGGQLNDWEYKQPEKIFSEYAGGDLQKLDEAQINPIKLDPTYGAILDGDRTLQVTQSDTSYIGARRGYNYIIENIENQILRKIPFRLNDPLTQIQTRLQVETFLSPILSAGYLREFRVICDDSVNTDAVKAQRQFKIVVYEKITPQIERVLFEFIKVGQTQNISSLLP
jgi:hypothetical protein